MATIFLTSTGLSEPRIRNEFIENTPYDPTLRVVIITTAAEGGKDNKYSILAKQQFELMGYTDIQFLDVSLDTLEPLIRADIAYVCGGNTFVLLDGVRRGHALELVYDKLQEADFTYVGVSAGSVLLTPTIRIAAEIEPDKNLPGLTNFSALSIIPFEIYPHYTAEIEAEILSYEHRYGIEVCRISNSEVIRIQGGKITKVI